MTKIIYQWEPWAYMHWASLEVQKHLSIEAKEIIGCDSFEKCWESLEGNVLVLAIENSTAGSIYENLYKFLQLDAKIIWEYSMEINHCLCSVESSITEVKKVYSHYKALPQCYHYLKNQWITKQEIHPDTAWSAKMLSETLEKWAASICSELAANMYGLNVLDTNIQDQKWNTTRFIIVIWNRSKISYNKKSNKISILFEAKDIPASLYKCLWAFAHNEVNLTKIESLSHPENPFSYLFWIDFEWQLSDNSVRKALDELKLFTSNIKVLGEY